MRFTPITEEQAKAQESGVWPDDLYDYEVAECTEETSRNGNEMLHLKVWIFDKSGKRKMLHDYLVSSAAWKIRQFAASSGLLDAFETGNLMEGEIVGRTGVCEVGIEPANGQWPEKNKIKTWCPKEPRKASAPVDRRTKHPAGAIDDEIPF